LTLSAIFASTYAAAVIVLAPIAFGPIQLRIADSLIPFAALFGWPVIVGVTLGCLLGNAYYWIGIHDVVLGPIANLASAAIIFTLRKRPLLACFVGSLLIGIVVGGYLWLFFPPPDVFTPSLPAWAAMTISLTASSLIAVSLVGYTLLKVVSRPSIVRLLKSYGLRIYVH
jgi:hypothetical protein